MIPSGVLHIRLPPVLYRRLEQLHRQRFAGLPFSSVAKLILVDALQREEEALARIVHAQIRKPLHAPGDA